MYPADIPPAVWISYHYVHNPTAPQVTQRVKLDALQPYVCGVRPRLAHVSNFVFERGFLAAHLRARVHWERPCRTRIEEHADLFEILGFGEGIVEEKAIRLVVGECLISGRACPCSAFLTRDFRQRRVPEPSSPPSSPHPATPPGPEPPPSLSQPRAPPPQPLRVQLNDIERCLRIFLYFLHITLVLYLLYQAYTFPDSSAYSRHPSRPY